MVLCTSNGNPCVIIDFLDFLARSRSSMLEVVELEVVIGSSSESSSSRI